MTQVSTRRIYRKLKHRPVRILHRQRSAGRTLVAAAPEAPSVILLVGDPPADWLEWAVTELPDGVTPGAHYLDGNTVVLRYKTPDGPVEIHEAPMWFGEGCGAADATHAYEALQEVIGRAFDGAVILATPATTGRELFLRTIPREVEYPVLDAETQDLIRATDGQGRIEVVNPFDTHAKAAWDMFGERYAIEELHEYDARFAYAALCWELPTGPVHHDDVNRYEGQMRGRYKVAGMVPRDWSEPFGLLGEKDNAGGWRYPHAPGEHFQTWCDGAELHVALQQGWKVEILERLLFPTVGRPLDTWAKKLVAARASTDNELVRTALRNILLQAVGAFHGRQHIETHMVRVEDAERVPSNARRPRRGGPGKEWIVYGLETGQGWSNLAHPEWSACIWGRGRARLLSAPKSQGALNREPGTHVVGFRTDAIYLTGAQPEWDAADDGAPGRYRSKGSLRTRSAWPRNSRELLELKTAMS